MKGEALLVGLGGIGEDLIAEAMEFERTKKENQKTGREIPRRRRFPLAAALIALMALGTVLFAFHTFSRSEQELLPLLEMSESDYGMGYEGYLLNDVSDLFADGRLSGKTFPTKLPVFRNMTRLEKGTFGISPSVTEAKMRQKLIESAALFGLTLTDKDITSNAMPIEAQKQMKQSMEEASGLEVPDSIFIPSMVIGEADGIRLEMTYTLTLTVTFEEPLALPNGLMLATDDLLALEQAGEWLAKEYGALFGFAKPICRLDGGDYDIDGIRNLTVTAIDSKETPYAFDEIFFYGDEEGRLRMIRVYDRQTESKIGNYPLLTLAEAREALEKGTYITSAQTPFAGTAEDCRVELVYRTGDSESYYLPYYRFLAEEVGTQVSEYNAERGFKTFTAYYVPAVRPEYLTGVMPSDGSFNGE